MLKLDVFAYSNSVMIMCLNSNTANVVNEFCGSMATLLSFEVYGCLWYLNVFKLNIKIVLFYLVKSAHLIDV